MARLKLTKRDACILGRYAQGLEPVNPRVLEAMADRLLDLASKQKRLVEYPVLSERQRKRRLAKEVPLGGLIELVSANPAARFPIGSTPFDPRDWQHVEWEEAA